MSYLRKSLIILSTGLLVLISIMAAVGYLFSSINNRVTLQLTNPYLEPDAALTRNQPQAQKAVTSSTQSNRQVPADLFFVRATGSEGPLEVYEMSSRAKLFTLPAGRPATDWQHYYAAEVQQKRTQLNVFAPRDGTLEQSYTVADGTWHLSGVSPTGRWVALTRTPSDAEKVKWINAETWQTAINIVDTTNGQIAHTLQLDGNFEVETISANGDALFLIQHLPAVDPVHYQVRLYNLTSNHLQAEPLRDKFTNDEFMTGSAWGAVASLDGRWLLTLYLNTQRNVAFIHALNLENKFPLCINLPSGKGDMEQLKHYSLVITSDSQHVSAANTALGVVAQVDLSANRIIHTAEFPSSHQRATFAKDGFGPTNYSLLSPDEQKLYFSSGQDIWGYDTRSGKVGGPYLSDTPIRGLSLSSDEQWLYAAIEGQSPVVVDLAQEEKAVSLNLD